ncbi:MAG: hypothetical protein WA663_02415 [Candidatus Acidiferrales bacterium]
MTKLEKHNATCVLARQLVIILFIVSVGSGTAFAQKGFTPGNLVVSRSVYQNAGNIVVGQTELPPNCSAPSGSCTTPPTTAISDGTYPYVWNNDSVDGSFGITSVIFLDEITTGGALVNTLEVPNSTQNGVPPTKDQMVTSFSSKSEVALNLSTDHSYITFMGYLAPVGALDVSNANTAGAVDPTNPVGENVYRVVAEVDQKGKFKFTKTNAYSGNNGRAAILNDSDGANVLYTAGNAGNGANPQPDGIITGTGMQIFTPEVKALVAQDPGDTTPLGSFNITQLGDAADKIGKDTNFRGLTIFDNVIYTSKGSGSNGINTVYFIDSTGTVCNRSTGVGLPASGATLPTAGIVYDTDPSVIQAQGVVPYNMCVLNGFNTKTAKKTTNVFPFGIWFANPTTMYVADEGNGTATFSSITMTYTAAAAQTTAGLQKWVLESGVWVHVYTLQAGLQLGVPYTVAGYPTGDNPATGLPWAPATDGLRNLTGSVSSDGSTATIYAITSTVSGNGDQGADPNKLVTITDNVAATSLPAGESFTTLDAAGNLEVLRGVSFTPGTGN